MSIQDKYRLWSENPYFEEEMRQELKQITDPQEIEDRFYTDLEFGTGGLRGIIAAGTNRMNKYVIRKVTQGLAECVCDQGPEGMKRGVVIAYDSRKYSPEFALEAALVLARNGVKVYLFDALRPTPELSFAIRQLHALAGIVVTASHNPKAYNGYKLYWDDGGQVPPEHADQILARIKARESWLGIEPMSIEAAKMSGLLEIIGEEIDRPYLARVLELALHPELDAKKGGELRIVYTPLHGAGNILVRRVLAELGFSSVTVVPEQELPDPEFTTVPYPNPEIPATFDLARKYGLEMKADLLLATDPDADRLGVVLRDPQGNYVSLTGNQIGVVLTYYILSQKKALGTLPENATIIKTVASTDLADEVARFFNVRVENVLTGFKFIAEKEKEMEEGGWGTFQFGFEESYGYLAGNFVRDKDAVIASVLLAEAALYYRQVEGHTLLDVLELIYKKFGYYLDEQESLALVGIQGKEEITRIMDSFRKEEILELGGIPVWKLDDYEHQIGKDISTGLTYPLTLPHSNVLRFSFHGGGFVMVRPSGTEPKIKFYFSVKADTLSEAEVALGKVKTDFMNRIDQIRSVR
ncbi:phosphoglucomutase (alpha-D-glucose-1,6-bisphosphate-dependent) [Candidatus Desulfosporosinus infrequens]|uniref:Phosphoglucomutase n=1 Tax=Candidatus Desulfosporosinus infrequens TaxID=2043169 RepID=A0A2U3KCQ0_9FIRM|nr:phosphoglucomutase (alpha-D-glucose-1,6-bisphosphate-dependent) [Candidatus Desulfosporosinus infrequens]